MARTNAADVQKIVETISTIWDTIFITDASVIVDDLVTCASNANVTMSASRLEMIERYIAAHLYTLRDREYKRKKTLDAEAEYVTVADLNMKDYWGMAVGLDDSGCLNQMSVNKKLVSINWLGTSRYYTSTPTGGGK